MVRNVSCTTGVETGGRAGDFEFTAGLRCTEGVACQNTMIDEEE